MLTRERKEKIVESLTKAYKDSSLILFADYKGMKVENITTFRDKLYENYKERAQFTIKKNTLVRLALNKAGFEESEWKDSISGTTAVLTVEDVDPIAALKIITDFNKNNKTLPLIKAGYLEGRFFTGDRASDLAKLPSREQLIAMVVGGFAAPITGFVYTLNGVLTKFLYALNAIKDKKAE